MRFYTRQHKYYCGIDLHVRVMYLCILDQAGTILLHRNMKACPDRFLSAIAPYREDLVVCVECMFTWYWLADLCARENIAFVVGHALYMRAIHGAKAKNDKIDSRKIAGLLRGGTIPQSYVYPAKTRSARDLLRRRTYFVRKRAELGTHVHNTRSQANLSPHGKKLRSRDDREGVDEGIGDPAVLKSLEADLMTMEFYDRLIRDLERGLVRYAKVHDPETFKRLQTVPGIGKILAMIMLYEIHDILRFPRVQDFVSYARLVKCAAESAGKRLGTSGAKIGNAHLKWAFSEAAVLSLNNGDVKKRFARLEKKHGKGKALSILAHKLGRAVYFMMKKKEGFEMKAFLKG
jgi:transposase